LSSPAPGSDDATSATEPVAAPVEGAGPRGTLGWLAVAVRGMAMGIAELVPGVSGGTIAFVTGIYDELIRSLAGLGPASLGVLRRHGFAAFWQGHNLSFLTVLALGMMLAVVIFAQLMEYLLDHLPTLVWAFFFGLIAASVVHIGRQLPRRPLLAFGLVGVLLAGLMLQIGFRDGAAPVWMFFLGGILAVSAWLLPAVSGSFLLLALGLYEPVLRAFNAGQWLIPLTLAAGCVVGLLVFSRALHWLMQRLREPVLALLTGFMAGSLPRLWPWQSEGAWLSPGGYEALTGRPALAWEALAVTGLGMLALWLLGRLSTASRG
jgi:putative membrane protein